MSTTDAAADGMTGRLKEHGGGRGAGHVPAATGQSGRADRLVGINQLIGYNVACYRKAAGLTQEELGKRLGGWTKVAVSAAERSWDGKRVRRFDADELVALAWALGVPVLALLLPPEDIRHELSYEIDVLGTPDLDVSALLALLLPSASGPNSSGPFLEYRKRLMALGVRHPEQVIEEVRNRAESVDQDADDASDILRDIRAARQMRGELEARVKELRAFEREYRAELVSRLQGQLLYLLGATTSSDSGIDIAGPGWVGQIKAHKLPGESRQHRASTRSGSVVTLSSADRTAELQAVAKSPATGPDAAQARDLYAALLPVIERVLGPEHPDSLTARADHADWTGHAGDIAEARDLYAELIPVMERVLREDHPDIKSARGAFAWWAVEAGDTVGSGKQSPEALDFRAGHANWTGEIGDPAGARDLFTALLPVMEQVLGSQHPDTAAARQDLARWTAEARDLAGGVA